MSTDLFSSPPAAQNPLNGIQGDKSGSISLDRTDKIRSNRESPDTQADRFFNTLRKVSWDQRNSKCTISADDDRRIEKSSVSLDDKTGEASIDAVPSEHYNLRTIQDSDPVPQVLDLDFTAFMNALAVMGMRDGGDESGIPTALNPNTIDSSQLAAIDTGIARLKQNPMALTVDLQAGVERQQQAIADAFNRAGAAPLDGKSDQLPASRLAVEVTNGSTDLKEISLQPMNIREDGVSAKMADLARQTGTENRPPNSTPSMSANISDTPQSKETAHFLPGPRIGGAENLTRSRTDKTDLPGELTTGTHQDSRTSQLTATSRVNSALTHVSEAHNHSAAGEEPVSRIIQDMQPSRDGLNRVKIVLNDETAGKVIKSETAANDNGLLNCSGQSAEKNVGAAFTAKEINAGQGMSREQTVDQLVRKAAIHLRNGQQEVRIDLKPDFLGHMRMQVISENHQVTVKILAEHGFVKDMLENNLHQLKADLQHQGLEVDKVEVSVSQDSEDDSSSKNKPAQPKLKQRGAEQRDVNHTADEQTEESRQSRYASSSGAIVDHFA